MINTARELFSPSPRAPKGSTMSRSIWVGLLTSPWFRLLFFCRLCHVRLFSCAPNVAYITDWVVLAWLACVITAVPPMFERSQHEAGDYVRWFVDHAFVVVPAQGIVAQHLMSFNEFPPRQRPGSFSVEQAMEKLRSPMSDN